MNTNELKKSLMVIKSKFINTGRIEKKENSCDFIKI